MTNLELIELAKAQYNTDNEYVLYEILYHLSKKTKTKNEFIINYQTEIDFKVFDYFQLCNKYFIRKKPLAQIIGTVRFCGLEFKIKHKVLEPREITEQFTWQLIHKLQMVRPMIIYDLCSGSGIIGIAIKKYCPQHKVYCVDKYSKQVQNIKLNAKALNVDVMAVKQDCLKFLEQYPDFDILVSNPPYVAKNDIDKDLYKFESKKSFIAKENGLYFITRFIDFIASSKYVKKGFIEIGYKAYNNLVQVYKDNFDI